MTYFAPTEAAPITLAYRIRKTGWANVIHFHGDPRTAARMALQFYKRALPRATEGPDGGMDLQIVNDEVGVFEALLPYYSDPIESTARPAIVEEFPTIREWNLGLETVVLVQVPMVLHTVASPISGEIDAFEAPWQAQQWAEALTDLIAQRRAGGPPPAAEEVAQ